MRLCRLSCMSNRLKFESKLLSGPVDLQRWIDLGVQPDTQIPVSSQAILKERVAEFLSDQVAVTIDGQRATGVLDRIHFIPSNPAKNWRRLSR